MYIWNNEILDTYNFLYLRNTYMKTADDKTNVSKP